MIIYIHHSILVHQSSNIWNMGYSYSYTKKKMISYNETIKHSTNSIKLHANQKHVRNSGTRCYVKSVLLFNTFPNYDTEIQTSDFTSDAGWKKKSNQYDI